MNRGAALAKNRSRWSESVYRKRLKEGRGQGELSSYKPWITIHDLASQGYSTRIFSHKTNRIHHLLSHNELYYFCLLEWSKHVRDIREQFPMRLTETLEIAANAGIKHPWDNRSRFPYVMTTDFLITTDKGLIARTVKGIHELSDKRVREKFEIERRYWERCGISWKIVTEEQIDITKAKNIIWLKAGIPENECISDAGLRAECEDLFIELYSHREISFETVLEIVEGYSGACPGAGLAVFKALVMSGRIKIDMSQPIHYADPRRL